MAKQRMALPSSAPENSFASATAIIAQQAVLPSKSALMNLMTHIVASRPFVQKRQQTQPVMTTSLHILPREVPMIRPISLHSEPPSSEHCLASFFPAECQMDRSALGTRPPVTPSHTFSA